MTATVPLSFDPRTGRSVPAPPVSTDAEVDAAVARAAAVSGAVAATAPGERAGWLGAVADAVDSAADELAELADAETALGLPRLTGELGRAAAALRFYASVGVEGSWLAATVDTDSSGLDLRRVNRPLGPVAVFGASNFPFGFGVLGHDTASALAAGCPVLVKAHPAHPRLSARLAEIATAALAACGAPHGAFGLVHGYDAGTRLVLHPSVTAVAFTGSEAGGTALWRLAATRQQVIPVYAEMGTVNAAVVTTAGAAERADEIAAGFVSSLTLGMGQFCTKPGLLIVPAGHDLPRRVADALAAQAPSGWLLTDAIADAYAGGVRRLVDHGAAVLHRGAATPTGWAAAPVVLSADPALLTPESPLLAECFGPAGLVCEYGDDAELAGVLAALPGSLAAAVHGGPDDTELAGLVDRLAARAGRVIVNGWPTGVAVTWAQQHGGPWPATTVPAASSVGAFALHRFVRPVAYQNVPDGALPPPLQEANPWGVPRRVDGRLPA